MSNTVIMGKYHIVGALALSLFTAWAVPAMAAGNLYFGSLGQQAGNSATFSVTFCNGGDASVAMSTPIAVTANNITVATWTPAKNRPIAPGSCASVSLAYAAFKMSPNSSYSASLSAPGIPTSSYFLSEPGGVVLGTSTVASGQISIDLVAQEVDLMKQLVSLIQGALR